jgi:hypothetical protein
MSASSSIAAAKRRRGGVAAPAPGPSQPQQGGRPSTAPNILTPQQRALLLQQQQLMAQQGHSTTQTQKNTVYNPNVNSNSNPNQTYSGKVQIVSGPNGVNVPVGADGKPLHPGVLIMEHEKRISELEKCVSNGIYNNTKLSDYDSNTVNFVIEEGESAPWEEDIGMLNLKLDELNKRLVGVEQCKAQFQQKSLNSVNMSETNTYELQSKVDLLERQLATTKELLLKVQSFAMETNIALLKFLNNNEVSRNNDETVSVKIQDDSEANLKSWIEAGSLSLQMSSLDELSLHELEKNSVSDEDPREEEENELEQES